MLPTSNLDLGREFVREDGTIFEVTGNISEKEEILVTLKIKVALEELIKE